MSGDFKLGEWLVSPALNQIGTNGNSTRVEPKAMQVLVYLAEHPGVVTKEQLISSVWPEVFVSEDVLPGCISTLRKAFRDNARNPTVIQTIHKNGYRLLLPVDHVNGNGRTVVAEISSNPKGRRWALPAALLVVLLLGMFVWLGFRTHYDSVAVLPFVNATGDANMEYLSDGIAQQVVDGLSQVTSIRVMAWTTVSRYRQPQSDVRNIGRNLGVKAVLTGRLVRSQDRVRLQTELVDVNNGSQLWGQTYDEGLGDISSLQQRLSHDIADNLRITLTGDDQKKMKSHAQASPEAYQLYLKGRFFWGKRTKDGMDRAISYFQQAIDRDPNYALAYAGLADCYNLLDDWGDTAPRDSFPKARAAAEKALALDDSLAEAHVSLAMVRGAYGWDWAGAEQEFRRAIQLNPNYVTAHQWYGLLLASLGRFSEAEVEVKKARDLDPLSPIVNMGVAEMYSWQGRHDEAIAEYKKVIELDPTFAGAYGNIAESYEQKHMLDEAVEANREKAALVGDLDYAERVTEKYKRFGYQAFLREMLDVALDQRKRGYVNPVGIAGLYAQLGDAEHALQWLEVGYQEHSSAMEYLSVTPEFDSIRSDPRFVYWLRVLNLPLNLPRNSN
ncbi:MAG TPA: tetratricopeptide repeat protein [Terriglobales bacterium]